MRLAIRLFPRSIDRGLIEAWSALFARSSASPFRDQLIAASLKPDCAGDTAEPLLAFRDQLIAASLKQEPLLQSKTWAVTFPRSIDRGLIEAHWRRAEATAASAFRDQLIAASLKRPGARITKAVAGCFPRSIDRGLIEAKTYSAN